METADRKVKQEGQMGRATGKAKGINP